jgi:hypothetical protein
MRVCAWPERFPAPALRRFPRILRGLGQGPFAAGLAALLVTLSRPAAAQGTPPIAVEREPGAEDCPDTAALAARVEAIIGHGNRADATPYRVTFSRSAQAFTAAIRSGAEGTNVRYLDAREPNCSALAHATAIALAVLFDADLGGATAEPAPEKPAEPATSEPPAAPAPPTKAPPSAEANKGGREPDDLAESGSASTATRKRVDPWLSIGAAALAGALRPVVPALVADAGLEIEGFRGTIGAMWALPQTIDLPPGSARENLVSGTLRACYALSRRGALRFDLCSGALIGAATAEARGFTTSEKHTELFLAFPAEVALSARSRFVGWQLSASALVLSPPNQFEVGGVGPTYRPPPVAGMFALRIFFEPLR